MCCHFMVNTDYIKALQGLNRRCHRSLSFISQVAIASPVCQLSAYLPRASPALDVTEFVEPCNINSEALP